VDLGFQLIVFFFWDGQNKLNEATKLSQLIGKTRHAYFLYGQLAFLKVNSA